MRELTLKVTAYSFDELDKKVQKKVVDKFKRNMPHAVMEEAIRKRIEKYIRARLKEYDINILIDDLFEVLIEVNHHPRYINDIRYAYFIGEFLWNGYTITIENSYNYVTCMPGIVNFHKSKDENEEVAKKRGEASKDFRGLYENICRRAKVEGFEEIKHQNLNETVINTIKENGIEFLDSGYIVMKESEISEDEETEENELIEK